MIVDSSSSFLFVKTASLPSDFNFSRLAKNEFPAAQRIIG
jgi:hypothetical protein